MSVGNIQQLNEPQLYNFCNSGSNIKESLFNALLEVVLEEVTNEKGRCLKHPQYQIKQPPTNNCKVCKLLWELKNAK